MGDIRIKHKDKDRDTYVIHWWEFQISIWRCVIPSESLLSYCIRPILYTPFYGKLYVGCHHCQWLLPVLLVKMVLYDFCTANQLSNFSSRMKNTRYNYRTANHLSVLTSVGIGSLYPFAHCHCTQHSRV